MTTSREISRSPASVMAVRMRSRTFAFSDNVASAYKASRIIITLLASIFRIRKTVSTSA